MSYNTWFPNYGQQSQYQPAWQPTRPDMMQYPQAQQMAPAQPQGQMQAFSVRPVTSREEAVAAQIDFLGPGTLMPDFGHGVIYLKRFNRDTGSCDFVVFEARQPEPETPTPEYATKADLLEMQQVIQGLSSDIDRLRGGKRIAED